MNVPSVRLRLGRITHIAVFALLTGYAGTVAGGPVDAVFTAAGDGDAARGTALLDGGVDVNGRPINGSCALKNTAVEIQAEFVRMLVAREADQNVRNSQDDTPLICATKYAGGEAAKTKLPVRPEPI